MTPLDPTKSFAGRIDIKLNDITNSPVLPLNSPGNDDSAGSSSVDDRVSSFSSTEDEQDSDEEGAKESSIDSSRELQDLGHEIFEGIRDPAPLALSTLACTPPSSTARLSPVSSVENLVQGDCGGEKTGRDDEKQRAERFHLRDPGRKEIKVSAGSEKFPTWAGGVRKLDLGQELALVGFNNVC
jgi:hypothetical protein